MTCFTKETVLEAYKTLSEMHPDPTVQGATQRVSAIRYFLALDAFYHKYQHDCDTRDSNDKQEFIEAVGGVCDVCPGWYSANFYYPLKKHSGDYCVGSNFYSAGQVSASLVNPQEIFNYPKRGDKPLFQIKNGVLLRKVELYENFKDYVGTVKYRVALALWLSRNMEVYMGLETYDAIKIRLQKVYTPELIDVLMDDEEDFSLQMDSCKIEVRGEIDITCDPINQVDIAKVFSEKRVKATPSNEFLPYLTALRTKPFLLLAGISGTGKSRIVRKLAQATVTEELQRTEGGYKGADFETDRWTLHWPANFELVQVKPNWHNSMDVVGYLSNIPAPHYVFTPFVEFIVRAWQHTDVPFFLCLDEMNLAPVEEYFAEYLSAVESRSFEGEGTERHYMTDPIIKAFNSFGKAREQDGTIIDVCKQMVDELFPNYRASDTNTKLGHLVTQLQERGLTLPPNLMVIGTVNMDETTFSFSRKVLDRAMSIEMNEVDYSSFLLDTTDDGLSATVDAIGREALNDLLVNRHIAAREVADSLGDDAQRAIAYLSRINSLLDGTPFKLGYRAANEALLYLEATRSFGQDDFAAAMDHFTLMKILSRIEGDNSKLRLTDSDTDMAHMDSANVNYEGDGMTLLDGLRKIVAEELGGTCRTLQKLDVMRSQLDRDQFVSYWN